MKSARNDHIKEEIAEVHASGKSPSPKHKNKTPSRSRSSSRRLSNGHNGEGDSPAVERTTEETVEKPNIRDNWIKSEHESLDLELPIHEQIKQGIIGFVEKEIQKADSTGTKPSFVFYSHDPNGLDDKYMKTLSRPSSGHKEKRSPSYRKKKKLSSRARDRELHEFEIPGSSLSALEKVDDYLKEYNKEEVITLSGDLEIESNDVENNNGTLKELRHKPRKTRRKVREERQDTSTGTDVSPKVFKTAGRAKTTQPSGKPARPTDLAAMLETLDANRTFQDQYIDNPFSSPSPLTSPDYGLDPFNTRRPEKIYLQGGGTFRAVSRDRILGDGQANDNKYLSLGDMSPLEVAVLAQKACRACARACPGVLAGLALMHLLLISCSDSLDAGHLSFHAVVTMPYVACYYFFCVLCLLSVLDRLDPSSLDLTLGLHPYIQPTVLVVVYTACLLVCAAARSHDEMIVHRYSATVDNYTINTINATTPTIPAFYHTWTHLSIWRAVLSILGLAYFIITNPQDMVLANLNKLLQFKPSLQNIAS